jgi:hypothetical protein
MPIISEEVEFFLRALDELEIAEPMKSYLVEDRFGLSVEFVDYIP